MPLQTTHPSPQGWKLPLASRVAEVLRQKTRNGTLPDPLPGESQLAADLGVSRSTVRDALQILAREGLVHITKGKRTRLAGGPRKTRHGSRTVSVCVIGSFDSQTLEPFYGSILGQARLHFAEAGMPWEQYFSLPQHNTIAFLDEIVKQRPHAYHLLVGVSRQVQEYFEKTNRNAIILGTNHPGVTLTAIDLDYRALAAHAGNLLLRRGCRQVITMVPEALRAGDTITRETIAAVFAKHPEVILSEEITPKGTRNDFKRICDRVLKRITPHTAIFCFYSEFTFALISRAAQLGLKVPRDFFLLSRDDHAYFSYHFPEISHYAFCKKLLQQQIVRIISRIQTGLPLARKSHLITPELVEGETLPPARH